MIRFLAVAACVSVFLPPALVGQESSADGPPSAATQEAGKALSPEAAAATITAADLHHRIGVLAHDSMRGRDTPSPELDQVATWIGREFRRMGLEPGGEDGGFEQRYDIVVLAADFEGSAIRSSPGARVAYGAGAVPTRFSSLATEHVEGPVLLVVGEPGAEAFSEVDVAGRHLVYVGSPRGTSAVARAAFGGDAASLLLATDVDDNGWQRTVRQARDRRSTAVGDGGAGLVALEARDDALGDLLGMDVATLRSRAASAPFVRELPDLDLSIDHATRVVSRESAPNVVGILRGSDPELKDEYVVFSAHMDHVGIGAPNAEGDSIYNGADDDASGTATVMEVAEAMAFLETRPRRSMIFLLVSGEEKGLWGSAWFASHPTVPLEAMVANVNADMVGRNWPDTIVAIGRRHSDLGATLERVNAAHPELDMTAIDDLWPEENFYRRSDHFNFARRGVPILFFFNGTHADYHGPDDELEAIDTDKTARIGRLIYWLGLEVGNADERPRWDPEIRREIVEGAGG